MDTSNRTRDITHATTTDIDTVIIGAGQAGLSTGYSPAAARHPVRHPRRATPASATTGAGSGTASSSTRPRTSTACPDCRSPRRAGPSRARTPSATTSRPTPAPSTCRCASRPACRPSTPTATATVVTTDRGRFTCRNVVVATGHVRPYGERCPTSRPTLDPAILQLHSSEYRRPGQINDGPVLVVGASHSGTDIAYELAETHPTILAGRDCGEIPPRLGSPVFRVVFPVLLFAWRHVLTRRSPMRNKLMDELRRHGGPMLRVKRRDLRRARGRARHQPGRGGARRQTRRRRHAPRRVHRRVGDRLPAGLRLDPPADPRRGRLAAGDARRRRRTPPGCSSAGCASSTPSARWSCPASAATRRTSPTGSPPAPAAGSRSTTSLHHGRLIAVPSRRWIRPLTTSRAATGGAAYDAWSRSRARRPQRRRARRLQHGRRTCRSPRRPGPRAAACVPARSRTRATRAGAARCAFRLAMSTADHGEHAFGGRLVDPSGGAGRRDRRGLRGGAAGWRSCGCSGPSARATSRRRTRWRTRPTPPGRRFHDARPHRDEHVRAGAGVASTPGASPRGSPSSTTRWCASSRARRRRSSPATSTAPPSRAPGDQRLRPGRRVDRRARAVVRRTTRAARLHRAVRCAPRAADAPARRLGRRAARVLAAPPSATSSSAPPTRSG